MNKQAIEQHLVVLPGGAKTIIDWNRELWLQGADPSRPLRLEVTTELESPGATGMPEGREATELDNLEHLLNALVRSHGKGEQVMSISGAGRRTHVFYLPVASGFFRKRQTQDELTPKLAELGAKAGRELRVTWFEDPEWSRLLGVFSAYDPQQWVVDRALLTHMVKAGDAVHARRSVAHRIFFERRESCPNFLREVRRLKLESNGGPKQGGDERWVVLVARTEPTVATWHMHPVVLTIKALARKHGGTYDGWEAEFVQTLIPPPLTGPKGS